MEMFKSNDTPQLAYICVPAGLHAMPTAVVSRYKVNHDRTITIILCPTKSFLNKAVQ